MADARTGGACESSERRCSKLSAGRLGDTGPRWEATVGGHGGRTPAPLGSTCPAPRGRKFKVKFKVSAEGYTAFLSVRPPPSRGVFGGGRSVRGASVGREMRDVASCPTPESVRRFTLAARKYLRFTENEIKILFFSQSKCVCFFFSQMATKLGHAQ